ncbi:MAG: SurA N-terminal domain-containing protein [Polyangiales bacterium]
MRIARCLPFLLGVACASAVVGSIAAQRTAHAEIVERVVAVVGDSPILYSELQQRSRPFMVKILSTVPSFQQKVAIGEMQKELLGKLVDERVVAIAADKLGVAVGTKEVDDSIKLKAADLKLTVLQLVAEAAGQGLSELDYREEVRRELLFSKMLETRMRARPRVTEDDTREYYRKLLVQERRGQAFRATTLTIDLPRDGNVDKTTQARTLADLLVRQARGGQHFEDLGRAHAGEGVRALGPESGTTMTPTSFGKAVDDVVLRLDAGDVSEPMVIGTQLTIIKVTERGASQIPPYAEVRDIVAARVREEQMNKQVRAWLDELKQGVYIDVRL